MGAGGPTTALAITASKRGEKGGGVRHNDPIGNQGKGLVGWADGGYHHPPVVGET